LLVVLALIAYGAVPAGGIAPALTGAAVSGIAMFTLGAALAIYTGMRVGAAPVRLGGRAASARRAYLTLAFVATGVLYLAVIFGAINTSAGTLWTCQTWPGCEMTGDSAWLALAHRGLAGGATLLIAALAVQTWRIRHERSLRIAVAWRWADADTESGWSGAGAAGAGRRIAAGGDRAPDAPGAERDGMGGAGCADNAGVAATVSRYGAATTGACGAPRHDRYGVAGG